MHIAGTNGKGSTAAMLASILSASGYRTGLYTSPHLLEFNERIRINGVKISDVELAAYVKSIEGKTKQLRATFFEATTAIAFKYFADKKIDIGVIETGLGGRFDATNVIVPLVSIITNISIDHTEQLGSSHRRIAFEKAGIIKRGVPCLTGISNRDALQTIRRVARLREAPLSVAQRVSAISVREQSLIGLRLTFSTEQGSYGSLFTSLAGQHQVENVRLALLASEFLKREGGFTNITRINLEQGLSKIRELSGLRGRLEVLSRIPLVIADVAHNPDSTKAAVQSLRKMLLSRVVVVFGVMKDKDYYSMIRCLVPMSRCLIAVQPRGERALASEVIVNAVQKVHSRALLGGTVENGLTLAKRESRFGEPILIIGSHYVVGEAMGAIGIFA